MSNVTFVGNALIDGTPKMATITVKDGQIQSVTEGAAKTAGDVVMLTADQVLLPSAIDMLAAARDWAEVARDTVETATKAALAGGITVFCDQPNTQPRINNPELVTRRIKTFADGSYVDYGIQSHPPLEDFSLIPKLKEAGAFGIAFFQWDLPPWNYPMDIDVTKERMGKYAKAGLQGFCFLEELSMRETPLEDEGERYAVNHFLRRLHPDYKMRVVVTLAESVRKLTAARRDFPNLRLQMSPHYLCMSREISRARIGVAGEHSAPLRSNENMAEMQALAREGAFDVFTSHHTPHRIPDKHNTDPVPGEFKPKRGFTSIDIAYPVYLDRMGFAVTCKAFCENPAQLLGVKKGKIATGYDADLVIVEKGSWDVNPDDFFSKGKVTPFVGEKLKYSIRKTFLRGTEVYDAKTRTFKRVPVRHIH